MIAIIDTITGIVWGYFQNAQLPDEAEIVTFSVRSQRNLKTLFQLPLVKGRTFSVKIRQMRIRQMRLWVYILERDLNKVTAE